MRRDADHFGDQELALVYVARRLKDALRLEDALTAGGHDYYVEAEPYISGTILRRQRVGAFFYVLPETEDAVRQAMRTAGFEPFDAATSVRPPDRPDR